MTPLSQLLLLPLLAVASAKPRPHRRPPAASLRRRPRRGPHHTVLLTNQTEKGGRLSMVDIYYDWLRRRYLNVLRSRLWDTRSRS
ncbi:hypothetical protein PR202_gb29460 [Eleusine coracana subsp. coracana]|uniref:Uncharacterized protein n=1 Tax=Eleusine coracana subsp. coracana TaxID=191504 RepID=A0AAV5FZW9_ELECO|nr:hypothetical protein PR202_gb29460 [Eleusine coracana subsp. coracana]